ncbi:MAG TPA: hypothetical protein VFW87_14705, partial [Pirellulales bacterium]|nr:hypothetical protein [Pirellulales bacterium]
KRHLVRLTVLKNHVRLLCDGKSIVDWTGDVSRLKSTEELPYHDRIYVGTWQARYRFTQMKLRALRDDTASEPTSALAGEPVDLLKRIDVARDQVDGDWKREGTALLSPRKAGARLQIPYEPGGEYTLTVTAERLSGTDSFILGLIVGGRQVAMTLDGYGGETSGLADLDQHDGATNETTRRGRLLPPGKPHTIVCTVRDGTVNVSCDDKQVLSWSGDPLRLTNSVFWTVPNHRQLFLGAWESEFKFTRVEMQPRRSASSSIAEKPLQQPAAGNPPQAAEMRPRTLGDLVAENSSRAEVPDDEALKKARHEMRKKFASSLKAAKLPEQKRRLAEDLAEKAAAAEGAAGYVLWIQAIDLAKASGDIELAWLTIDRFARAFDVDRASLRNDSLAAIGKAFRSPEHAWALTDAACRLMVWALAAGDAEAVRKAATQAQNFARRLDDRSAQKVVTDRANDAGKLADEWDAVAAARQTLKDSPGDPEANFTVGHYELCAAGDWDAALPKLARCGAAAWKEAAADELALAGQVADPQRQMATGDGWWSLAEDEPWPGRHFLQVRAARRYRLANRGQPNDIPIRALERLKALLAVDEGLPNWEVFRWQGFQAAAPSGEVARLENMFSLETVAEFSEPIEVLLVVKTSGTEVRLGSHGWSWNWKFVVEPDQWHTLRYVINPLSRTVFVDGVLMQTDASRTPRSLNSAPVALHRNNDAVIEIRKFIVRPL